ncbi:hypothetical protein [Niastella sp. OAS944]|uniref:hypothetical protein n=1 Tax=Niastella sp. OAS944 TaxID=2664089 RepID=UPI00348FC35E|nr:uncharacterized protein YodC (DUF2158 family) [Chitinophagaceae bacterium OAS944]
MKRIKNFVPVLVLLVAVTASFAFRKATVYTCTWYDYVGAPGQEFDPANYVPSVGTPSWPGQGGALGGICVDASDIYSSGTYAGLPKVDDYNMAIANVVTYALESEEDNYQIEDFNEAADLKAP